MERTDLPCAPIKQKDPQKMRTSGALHMVVFPFPIQGHLSPVTEFCKLLAAKDVTVTFVVSEDRHEKLGLKDYPSIRVVSLMDTMADSLDPANWDGLMQGPQAAQDEFMKLMTKLEAEASEEGTVAPPCCIISDFFTQWVQGAAEKFKIPNYVLLGSSTTSSSIFFHAPELFSQGRIPLRTSDVEPISHIPGMPPFLPSENIVGLLDGSSPAFDIILNGCRRLVEATGFITNSCEPLEDSLVKAGILDVCRKSGNLKDQSIFQVGPLLPRDFLDNERGTRGRRDECVEWLDKQPNHSVLYLSLGSYCTFSAVQMLEVARGLEASNQRFLWVVRAPQEGGFAKLSDSPDVTSFLPEGFQERVQKRALLVPGWVSQFEVLSHPAIGGFWTHCGWGSTVESISKGVPMLAWPIQAEQGINCRLVVDRLKVAFEFKKDSDGLVAKEEVERLVRMVMVGEESISTRKCVENLRDLVLAAVGPAGSSSIDLQAFLDEVRLQKL